MAKKGGLNLAGSADASIVASATKAAMAAKPVDLSKAFGMVATGYSQMVQKFGAIGAKLGHIGGVLAAPLVDKAINNIRFHHNKTLRNPAEIPEVQLDRTMHLRDVAKGNMLGNPDADIWSQLGFDDKYGDYGDMNKAALSEEDVKLVKQEGRRQKNAWIERANNIRAGHMANDYAITSWSEANETDPDQHVHLLFFNASKLLGNPIPDDFGDDKTKDFRGVQALPIYEDGQVKDGLFKDGRAISGLDQSDPNNVKLLYVDENPGSEQYTVSVNEFNKHIIPQSGHRPVWNGYLPDVLKNAKAGGNFDKQAWKHTLMTSVNADGVPIGNQDVADLGNFPLIGVSEKWWDHLNKINPTTAEQYIKTNPSILSQLKDITGDGKINIDPTDNIPDDISFEPNTEGYKNAINAMKKDKNALIEYVATELEKKHNDNFVPKKVSGSGGGGPAKTTYQMPGTAGGGPQHVEKNLIDPQVKLLKDEPNFIETQEGWNGVMWRKDWSEGYQIFDHNINDYVNIDKKKLISNLKFGRFSIPAAKYLETPPSNYPWDKGPSIVKKKLDIN